MELTDTHAHLDFEQYDSDRQEVIARAREAGVNRLIAVGANFTSIPKAIKLAESDPLIWATAGVHPHEANEPLSEERLVEAAAHHRVVAIGETGFDFHYDFAPRAAQEAWFRLQVRLAKKVKKPLIIHCRKAPAECLALLREEDAAEVGGVFHCFSEDDEFAAYLREINFLISVGGVITFKNATALQESLKKIPIEQIMLETDAPYLAPQPFRGKRCESSYIPIIAEKLAEIKEISVESVAEHTTANAIKLFGLK